MQIDDEPLVEQIVDKWREHDDLIGKPRLQVLKLLFADVQAAGQRQRRTRSYLGVVDRRKIESKALTRTLLLS